MGSATKAYIKPHRQSDSDQLSAAPESNSNPNSPTVPETVVKKSESTDEKALDRWFLEQRGNKRVPKRLNIPNELLVTTAGQLKLIGNITLINEDGSVTRANNLNLCRCGASNNRPFCDEQHLEVEFFDGGAVTRPSDCMPVTQPQSLTVTCVKDGPLKFRGYLRIYNKKGQECITTSGALCRCGKSSKKPFCDNGQSCEGG